MQKENYYKLQSKKDILYLKLKNFWTEDIANKIENEFKKDYASTIDSFNGIPFYSLIEFAPEFKPVEPKVKEIMSFCMHYSNTHNLKKSIQIMPDAVQRLSLEESVKKAGHNQFRIIVSSLDEGLKKIEEIRKQRHF